LQQNFIETDSNYLLSGRVNPIKTFPGEGTFFFGNQTAYTGTLNYLNKINVMLMVSYLKKELLKIAQNLLYEINNANTRQRFIGNATAVLENLQFQNGIERFKIICDETNNTSSVIQQNKLVANVFVQPVFAAETIEITIINTTESEIFTS
jgi:phage tail sheath protein FI